MKLFNVLTNQVLKTIELGEWNLKYSAHALEQAQKRKINLSKYQKIMFKAGSVVEIERDDEVKKVVLKVRYDKNHNLILVAIKSDKVDELFIKTVYLNNINDNHRTLIAR